MAQSHDSKFITVGDWNLNLCSSAELIGKYVKYYVTASLTITQQQPAKTQVNAFTVMMAASRAVSKANAELTLVDVRTEKDKLYNDLVSFTKLKSLKWNSSEISSGTAAKCLSTLRDALWYIDGMSDTLNERSCTIPEVFNQFTGYNKPEIHKHRKRACQSLSRELLLFHSQALFSCVSNPFWSREMWLALKKDVEQLSRSLASYADHLLDKRTRMHSIYSSREMTRTIAENLSISYIENCRHPSLALSSISDQIDQMQPNTPLDLRPLLPNDRRRRYEWIQKLKGGLQMLIVHVQYSPGSNIGDLHWIWQCAAENIDDALKICH